MQVCSRLVKAPKQKMNLRDSTENLELL